jgi:hypothetical protein
LRGKGCGGWFGRVGYVLGERRVQDVVTSSRRLYLRLVDELGKSESPTRIKSYRRLEVEQNPKDANET